MTLYRLAGNPFSLRVITINGDDSAIVCAVGDDYRFLVEFSDLEEITEEDQDAATEAIRPRYRCCDRHSPTV